MLDLKVALSELGAKINAGFAAVKTSVENFSVLRDAAAGAIKARDDAREVIVKQLDDLQASIKVIRDDLDKDSEPAPAPPTPTPTPTT